MIKTPAEVEIMAESGRLLASVFTWLDGQFHDFGPQPWGALREALRGHELEATAVAEVEKVPPEIESDPAELRNILILEKRARDAADRQRAAESGDIESLQRLLQKKSQDA